MRFGLDAISLGKGKIPSARSSRAKLFHTVEKLS